MYRPPSDSRESAIVEEYTWSDILLSYAVVAAIPAALWFVSQPLTGTVLLAVVAGLVVAARRAYELVRCFYDCPGMAFDLGGKARITVTQIPTDDSC
ncbi:hypothetical protein [Halorussus aquaticus]|uniref:Uncharacterized protein n=1 Tax=Halorussus aquaticus TaxID=2953748 RepID=A0ABD5PXC4_9EURY|nr:hypothetical protein [Halorussus aquaticus]